MNAAPIPENVSCLTELAQLKALSGRKPPEFGFRPLLSHVYILCGCLAYPETHRRVPNRLIFA